MKLFISEEEGMGEIRIVLLSLWSWSGSTGPIAGRGGPETYPRGGSHDIRSSSNSPEACFAEGTFGGGREEARIPSAGRVLYSGRVS